MSLNMFKMLLQTADDEEIIKLLNEYPELAEELGETEERHINDMLELDYDIDRMRDLWAKPAK